MISQPRFTPSLSVPVPWDKLWLRKFSCNSKTTGLKNYTRLLCLFKKCILNFHISQQIRSYSMMQYLLRLLSKKRSVTGFKEMKNPSSSLASPVTCTGSEISSSHRNWKVILNTPAPVPVGGKRAKSSFLIPLLLLRDPLGDGRRDSGEPWHFSCLALRAPSAAGGLRRIAARSPEQPKAAWEADLDLFQKGGNKR